MRNRSVMAAALLLVLACGGDDAMHPGDAPRDAVEEAGHAAEEAGRAVGTGLEGASAAATATLEGAAGEPESARRVTREEEEEEAHARKAAAQAEHDAEAAGRDAVKALEGSEYEQFERED